MRRWVLCAAVFMAGCALLHRAQEPRSPLEEIKKQIRLKSPTILSAGAAKVEITPAVGTPLAGYAKRYGKPSVGIRDPLYARVLALSDGEDTLLFISCDLLVFPNPLAQEVLDKLCAQFKIPKSAIFLSATHTHSGIGAIGHGFLHEQVFGPYQPEIVEGLTARIVWAVQQAMEHRDPVRWGVGEGDLGDLLENRSDPKGLVDPTVRIFLIESLRGVPVGVVVNADAHPMLVDSKERRFSADYPGVLTQVMEKSFPGSVCLFVNGAAGNVQPKDAIGMTPGERVGRFGEALAEVALGLVNQIDLRMEGDLASWERTISLPPVQMRLGWVPLHPAIGRLMQPSSASLNLGALGRMIFVPLPVELTVELGLDLKQRLKDQNLTPFLLGYTNGYLGYAVTPEQYKAKSYEAWMTWYGPNFGAVFIEEVRLLASLYKFEANPHS